MYGVCAWGKDGDNGDKKKQHGEDERGRRYDNRDRERDMCMYEFSWYDPSLIVNNGTNMILPGIQVCCMWYGVWCMG